jgi:probable rRNA maturation factor
MVNITNEEMTTPINIQQLETDAQTILNLMGYAHFDLGILLTDNQAIQCFNRDFRNKDVPTDILSFPFHTDLKPGETVVPATEDDKNIGDLIISLEYIKPLCEEENKTINEYVRTLLCHGICHLLGYDHYTESTDKIMKEKEAWLAENLAKQQ